MEAGKLQLERVTFDLRRLIEDALSVVSPQAQEKNINLVLRWDEDLPRAVESDPGRIRLVLLNLLSNAIKFTDSGEVGVSVTKAKGDCVRFSVRDTGTGISEETISRLFQPFTLGDATTTRRFGGTGLGLAISQRFVNGLGGELKVSSRVGEGSTFEFELRLPPADLDHCPEGIAAYPGGALSGRVLIVEDGAVNRIVACRLVEALGCTAEVASSGTAALAMARDQNYDMILMDCVMPDMDGYETTRLLRSAPETSQVPIVGLSANAGAEDRRRALESGMDAYLTKPVDLEQLRQTLGAWLAAVPAGSSHVT
jgi:CheY-like chemotaxis protein/anti-sigma regulatory factor (Ser/Thr protein kinase)